MNMTCEEDSGQFYTNTTPFQTRTYRNACEGERIRLEGEFGEQNRFTSHRIRKQHLETMVRKLGSVFGCS